MKHIYHYYVLILTVSIIFVFHANAFANTAAEYQTVRVGYHPNDNIVGNIANTGHEGYGYEVLKKVESVSNLRFEFIEIHTPFSQALNSGNIDIVGPVFKTPANKNDYFYQSVPIGKQLIALTTKKSELMFYDDPQSINGKTVATFPGNIAHKALDAYLAKHNISVHYVMGNMKTYTNINADYYLMNSGDVGLEDFHSVLNLGIYDTYLVSTPAHAKTLTLLDKALTELMLTEGNFFSALQSKYEEDARNFHRNLKRSEANKLKGTTFIVGYADNHQPYTYKNELGKADGANVELMNVLAKQYGFNVKYIPYTVGNAENVYHSADIIISPVGANGRRFHGFVPTEPYAASELVAISPNDVVAPQDDINNLSSEVQNAGILMYEDVPYSAFITEGRKHVNLLPFTSFDDLLKAYKNNEIQIAVFTNDGLRYANATLNSTTDHVFSVGAKVPLTFSFNKELAGEYVPIFNIIFDNLRVSAYYDLMVGHVAEYSPPDNMLKFISNNWHLIAGAIASIWLLLLINALRQYQARNRDVQHILDTDEVTGHMSSHKFSILSDEMLRNAQPNEYELISFDIDMFKSINTYYSVEKGTDVIKVISNALHDIFADEDTIFTRKYGDHFLILRKCEHMPTIKEIITHQVMPAIQEVMCANFNLSMSVGMYTISDPTKQMNFMIDHVDTARRSGKGMLSTTFKEFDHEMQKKYDTRLDVTYHMENALLDKEFFVMYQPKIDMNKLQIDGAEALVRWRTAGGKMIFPDQFIPEFEQNGFINKLDVYVFEEVCQFIRQQRGKITLPTISVNLSALTFLDEFIVDKLSSIAKSYDINPSEIELEITESAMNVSENEIIMKVKQFKSSGFTVSIDDFGAGISSLNRLGMLDVDVLKMDKAFLDNNVKGSKGSIVIENTINLAKDLGMKVVSEGVETAEQAIWLRNLGCDMVQGYYFERPVETKMFEKILLSSKTYVLKNTQNNVIDISAIK